MAASVSARGAGGETDPRRRERLEVLVFLLLIVPSMLLSFLVVRQGGLGFVPTALAVIGRDFGLVSLILFFLWRNGEPVGRIGWTVKGGGREASLGVALFVALFAGVAAVDSLVLRLGVAPPATPLPGFLTAKGAGELALALILVAVVAVAEETIFRGYLIHRLTAVTNRPGAAALLSAIVFSLGHGYEGTAGVVTVGVMGWALGLVYLWRRSLVAPIVMHFLQDFGSIVLMPLLGRP